MQYQYDGLFNRASKTVSGTTTKYLVDPNGFLPQAIAEMDAGGNITSYYVYNRMGLVAKMASQSVHFYHYDGIGNTIAMTDASGNMVNKYAYDEFGNLLNSVEAVSNPFLYSGRYGVMDEDNGLLYMRARYYDPVVGRFINKDPIGYWGGINMYAYAANNPISHIDPLGLLRDCDAEHIECFRKCWNQCPPWPIERGKKGHYMYCQTKCLVEYMECVAENQLELTFSTLQDALNWLSNHPEVAIGTIIVAAGVIYIVSTGGAGVLILVPVAL
jgi:RHS repeat-associated protein